MDPTQLNMAWLITLASSPLTLGFIVYGVIAMLKRDYERTPGYRVLSPWAWRGAAALVGLAVSLILHLITDKATLGYPGWGGAALFGLAAAVVAVLGRDGLKTALGWLTTGAAVAVGDAGTVNVNVPPIVAPVVNPAPVVAPEPAPTPLPAPEPAPTPAPIPLPDPFPVTGTPVPLPDPFPVAITPTPLPEPTPPPVPIANLGGMVVYPPGTPGMDALLHRGQIIGSVPPASSTTVITPEVHP